MKIIITSFPFEVDKRSGATIAVNQPTLLYYANYPYLESQLVREMSIIV